MNEGNSPVEISISSPFIALDAFLKWANVVESGGQAKLVIADGLVRVNGEAEGRRGRKLYPGDRVSVEGADSDFVVTAAD